MARPRSEEAREKMLAAATEVVLDMGIAGFSIDEISRRSGVAKTTIYRHFPDSSELLVTAVDRTVTYPEAPDTGSLRGDIVELLRRIHPSFADIPARSVHFELFAAMSRDPELEATNRQVIARGPSPLTEVYRRWLAAGAIDPSIDLMTAFEIIDGPFVFRSIIYPEALVDVDFEALADRIVRQLRSDSSAGATRD